MQRKLLIVLPLLLLGSLVWYLLTHLCISLPRMPIPTEQQLHAYQEKVDNTRLPALLSTLQSVQDAASAERALPELLRQGCGMREDYEAFWKDTEGGFDSIWTTHTLPDLVRQAGAIDRLLRAENEYHAAAGECYAPLLRELERLRAANYYGQPTLGRLLLMYIADEVNGEPLLLWYPGSQLRALAARQKGGPLYGQRLTRWSISMQCDEQAHMSTGREQHLDMLFLDLCFSNNLRGHENLLVYPWSPLIRSNGNNALFADCMCAGFCLNSPLESPHPRSEEPLPFKHPLELLSMKAEELRALPEYAESFERPDGGGTLVLKLAPPFLSHWLYIRINEEGRPEELHFMTEEMDRNRREIQAKMNARLQQEQQP